VKRNQKYDNIPNESKENYSSSPQNLASNSIVDVKIEDKPKEIPMAIEIKPIKENEKKPIENQNSIANQNNVASNESQKQPQQKELIGTKNKVKYETVPKFD